MQNLYIITKECLYVETYSKFETNLRRPGSSASDLNSKGPSVDHIHIYKSKGDIHACSLFHLSFEILVRIDLLYLQLVETSMGIARPCEWSLHAQFISKSDELRQISVKMLPRNIAVNKSTSSESECIYNQSTDRVACFMIHLWIYRMD